MEMEQIRYAAHAHYNSFTEEQKRRAYAVFQELDINGDGRVTMYEFEEIMGTGDSLRPLFQQLDTNRDGHLDYGEFITLYYLIICGRVPLNYQRPRAFGPVPPRRQRVLEAIQLFNTGYAFGQAAVAIANACSIM